MNSEEDIKADAKTAPLRSINTAETHKRPANRGARASIGKPEFERTKPARDRAAPTFEILLSFIDARGFRQHFQPDSTILLHGDPADALYLIESGTVRCSTIDAAGNRQIFAFRKKGDIVGLSDRYDWHFTAEAVDHVILKSISRTSLDQELAVNISLRQDVGAYLRGFLLDRERQLLTLVTTKGPERLYRFLEDFAGSHAGNGNVVLPMSRRDIGDHIGLSTESVSRAFGHLKRKGLIELKTSEKYRIVAKFPVDPEAGPRQLHG